MQDGVVEDSKSGGGGRSPSWVRERLSRQAAMLHISDRMALLDANLGADDRDGSSSGEGSDEVFYNRPSHPLGGGVVDSGLYAQGAAENDSESTVFAPTGVSTNVTSISTVTPSSLLTNSGDLDDDADLDLDGLMMAETSSEGGCHIVHVMLP